VTQINVLRRIFDSNRKQYLDAIEKYVLLSSVNYMIYVPKVEDELYQILSSGLDETGVSMGLT
jgi:hypothetical protein